MKKKNKSGLSDYKTILFNPRIKYNYRPDEKKFYDIIIVGTGVVGYSTAMYAGRLGLKTLIIGELAGGTITLTNIVENYPGFVSISGMELAKVVESHAKDYAIDILSARVEKIAIQGYATHHQFDVFTKGRHFTSKTIVFATGSKWKKLGVPGEKEYENRGVSYCALCDGPLFKRKTVAVVGGGDSAVKEALLLTEFAKKVYIIYRGDKIHPEPVNLKRAEALVKKNKLEIINNTNIAQIIGDDSIVTGVVLDKPYSDSNEFFLDGLFIDIGHDPLSGLARDIGINVNEHGEIVINRNSETNFAGFYAAGDVTDTDFKQAITGVAEGVQAAYHAYEYINKGEFILPMGSETSGRKNLKKK